MRKTKRRLKMKMNRKLFIPVSLIRAGLGRAWDKGSLLELARAGSGSRILPYGSGEYDEKSEELGLSVGVNNV